MEIKKWSSGECLFFIRRSSFFKFVASIMVLTVVTVFTARAADKDASAPLSVYVVNYPLQYFAERIGGPDVRVTFPVPADTDPAFWKPPPEQVVAYQKADLILLNGASYAKWVAHVSLPASRMVDTSASFAARFIPLEDQVTHSHGLAGKHEHGDVAFTTWLDPKQAIVQARAIRDALIRLRPDAAGDFEQRFAGLERELQELDDELAAAAAKAGSQPLIFSHPVYQYFIRRYVIDGYTVHWEPEQPPSLEQWAELDRLLAQHPARWMLWEGTPDPATVAELEKRGLKSVVFDPCGNVRKEGDYLTVMRENVRRLSEEQW
jgi:zinc transport system substrate-binding protein